MSAYPYPPGESHPDPAFLREWLTRDTGPGAFRRAVREGTLPRTPATPPPPGPVSR